MTKEEVIEILHYYRDLDREVKLIAEQMARLDSIGSILAPERQRLEERKQEIAREKDVITKEIDRLRINEKVVIYEFYVLGKEWRKIAGSVNYSASQCKNIRNEALRKLAGSFSRNETVEGIGRRIK